MIVEKKYEFAWQEKSSLLIGLGHQIAVERGLSKIFNAKLNGHLVLWEAGQSHAYFSEESFETWKNQSKNFLEEEYLQKFLDESKKLREDFYKEIERINKSEVTKLSNKELFELLKGFYEAVIAIQGIYFGSAPEGVFFVDQELKDLLKKDLKKEEITEEYSKIIKGFELDLIQQEVADWLTLLKNIDDQQKLIEHAKTYPAFFFNTYDWKSIISYLENRKKQQTKEEVSEQVIHIHAQKQKVAKERKEVLRTVSKRAEFISEIIIELGNDRLQLKNCWSGAELLILDLLEEIARRIGIKIETLLVSYGLEDIEKALGIHLTEDEINARKEALFYKIEDEKTIFISGKAAIEEIKKITGEIKKDEKKVKGLAANKGTISGRVKIVLVEDIEKLAQAEKEFQKEDILVTTMTSPNMLPLIRKAAGIVTNEGGICSHAAIISREITTPRKKPCIVGTKHATRIFETGNYILLQETGEVIKITKEEHEKNIEELRRGLEK